jgi:hypothetical protein
MSKASLENIKVKFPPETEKNLNGSIDKPPKSNDSDLDAEEKRVRVSIKQEQFEREKADRQLRDKYSFKAFKVVKKSLWGWAILLFVYGVVKFLTRHEKGGFEIFSDQVLIAITTATTYKYICSILEFNQGFVPLHKNKEREIIYIEYLVESY